MYLLVHQLMANFGKAKISLLYSFTAVRGGLNRSWYGKNGI